MVLTENEYKGQKIIGVVCFGGQDSKRELSFEEILLDETLVQGDMWVLKEALQKVGGINYRLKAKRNYELALRISKKYAVFRYGQEAYTEYLHKDMVGRGLWVHLGQEMAGDEDEKLTGEGLKTDCYLAGRYRQELNTMGCFGDVVFKLLSDGGETIIAYLERMLTGSKEFYFIYNCTQPILIYIHDGADLNPILITFSKALAHALEELGQCVEYFDMSKHPVEELVNYTKRHFKAVIGMQTTAFSLTWENGGYVHDAMAAPKYRFVFDHPIWFKKSMECSPSGLCLLTLDGNYVDFIKKFYGFQARFLPPAGDYVLGNNIHKDYGIVFLGSYGEEPLGNLRLLRSVDRKRAYFLNRYILYMRKNLDETPERALEKTLEYYGVTYSQEEFVEILWQERWAFYGLADYFRNKVIKALLEAGIALHVFGDTWKNSPMWGHQALIRHEAVTGEASLEVYARAKLSLNIMRWHKDGFTERIANAMLNRAVVVTDKTTYLEKNFLDGEELIMFDLKHIEELPCRVMELLQDENKRKQIAENGYQKAALHHTWRNRASKMLEWIEEDFPNREE